ncbi:MAG: hypothetical protein IPO27_09325 [Bacteroidetes bacterium]|nr:hypothetical protein [Bacteroidota bacterium]
MFQVIVKFMLRNVPYGLLNSDLNLTPGPSPSGEGRIQYTQPRASLNNACRLLNQS